MLKELRAYPIFRKDVMRGLCANRDCNNIATKACSKCGLRYCCAECQKEDWMFRHKRFCVVKDLGRTKTIFKIFAERIEDYSSGKTSMDRYFSISKNVIFKDKLNPVLAEVDAAHCYLTHKFDSISGRVLSVLEDHEQVEANSHFSGAVFRADPGKLYLVNRQIVPVPLISEQLPSRNIIEIDPGNIKYSVELVPLNRCLQEEFMLTFLIMTQKEMRQARYKASLALFIIRTTIEPIMGRGYGNPVFLSLENVLAYEDFISKNFAVGIEFPFNLLCSILYPQFKFSMRTGNLDDDNKCLNTYSDDDFIEKYKCPPSIQEQYQHIADDKLAEEEDEYMKSVMLLRPGEEESDRLARYRTHKYKELWWRFSAFDITTNCSESLAVLPIGQSVTDEITGAMKDCEMKCDDCN